MMSTSFNDPRLAATLESNAAIARSGIEEGRKIGAREERARAKGLLEAAQFVIENLPGALFNTLGRTSYEFGEQARTCAERELVNVRAAIAAYTKGRA